MDENGVKYGELVVIGSENQSLVANIGPKRRFGLFRPEVPTAVMPSRTEFLRREQMKQQQQTEQKGAAICMELKECNIVVSFESVDDKDMYQIGRAMSTKNQVQIDLPTVSRYACRIVIDRRPPHPARIYAGAFNDQQRLFLGQNATVEQVNGEYDAVITNGILILHPPQCGIGSVTKSAIDAWKPQWREVSISGKLYRCKERREKPDMAQDLVSDETNELIDGTILDIGGALLLWRSFKACASFDDEHLQKNVNMLNNMHMQCPVELQTLVIKRNQLSQNNNNAPSIPAVDDPCVFMNCGHVFSGKFLGSENCTTSCPLCRTNTADNISMRLQLGLEPRIYVDKELPSFAFKPCGHIASENTARYWSKISMRGNTVDADLACPFCLTPLLQSSPIMKLYFPSDR